MNRKLVERVETGDNDFDVTVDGVVMFSATREHLKNGRRGHWLLSMNTPMGFLEVDRDQYSNDIMERCSIHVNERPYYGHRFKIPCDKKAFHAHMIDVIHDLEFYLGGEWDAEYRDWDGYAVYVRKV
jgi:hypothetical protein